MARVAARIVLLLAAAAVALAVEPASGKLRAGPGKQAKLSVQQPAARASAEAKPVELAAQAKKGNATAQAKPVRLAAQERKGNATAAAKNSTQEVPNGPRRRQTVRVCNAHPDVGGLSIWQDDGDSLHIPLNDKAPIAPKACREFVTNMGLGDYLELRIPSVREPLYLPAAPVRQDTVALVVVYEKPKNTPGMWLHYFDHLANAQVAAVSVAAAGGGVQLACVTGSCDVGTNETLPFGDVHVLFPGRYTVAVPNAAPLQLDAEAGASYAVLSMGPGEAMVFPPQKPPQAIFSGAAPKGLFAVAALATAAALAL